MPNNITHFAIHADDTERCREFYQNIFGWKFQTYGPPGFYLITTGSAEDPGIGGALHSRRDSSVEKEVIGFECSVSVDDIDETIRSVEQQGAKIVMPKVAIPGVGVLFKFLDPAGNIVCAIQYEQRR